MIGMAYVTVRRRIGPREVLQAAPWAMQAKFWALVGTGIGLASVTVSARGEIVQQTNWIAYWPMVVAGVTWAFSAGAVWAQFSALKSRIESLEVATVKKDVLAETLAGLKSDIAHVRELLENNSRGWRDLHHGSKE